ncbi:putative phage abortive infection protein [Flavobacterium sp. 9]|uniref:putative phage abortive infection protein n=1 Tax=Flavobacterium sp. 9 TaxID=2035198 RepID=UPI000C18DE9C|nr:putative phage abortive infection protein [Flavobacterium sp. 9]PIF34317.1 putative phage abortive infection protein [Flavobacterium sp. 9]
MSKEINKENEAIKFGTRLSILYIILGVLGFVLIMLPMIAYSSDKLENVGIVGDTLGGILNPIFAVPATILTFLAFWVQFKANQEVQNQFKIQQFESQFYEMVRLHKENINEMKISGYDYNISKTLNEKTGDSTITRSQVERFVEGRKVFVSMVKELIACYEFCKLYDITNKYNSQELLELSYRIFFFGSQSSLVSSKTIDDDYIQMIKDQLKIVRDKHKESIGGINEFYIQESNKTIKLHIKYAPFTGHENRLSHYYRYLYSTVKYVVGKEKEGLITYNKSREYLKVLRAQISNDEQLMLYYNYIIGFGKDWENEGYLTKYRMLHNLPIDKVKYAVAPRVHFQSFISSINQDEGDLFEWGDIDN